MPLVTIFSACALSSHLGEHLCVCRHESPSRLTFPSTRIPHRSSEVRGSCFFFLYTASGVCDTERIYSCMWALLCVFVCGFPSSGDALINACLYFHFFFNDAGMGFWKIASLIVGSFLALYFGSLYFSRKSGPRFQEFCLCYR